MDKASLSKKSSPVRRAMYGGVVGGLGGVFGALLVKPLAEISGDFAPWVLPVVGAGVISALLLLALLVPLCAKGFFRE